MNGTPAPEPVQVEEPAAEEVPVAEESLAEEPVSVDPPATEEPAPVETPEGASKFSLIENDIYMEGQRVGGIYENGLRCSKGFADLRDEIEAWLNTQPQ